MRIFFYQEIQRSRCMTTKAPSPVKPAAESSLEKVAYTSVSGIPAAEPHDVDRLGYNIWQWLKTRRGTLEFAVKNASARLTITEEEAVSRIRESLKKQG